MDSLKGLNPWTSIGGAVLGAGGAAMDWRNQQKQSAGENAKGEANAVTGKDWQVGLTPSWTDLLLQTTQGALSGAGAGAQMGQNLDKGQKENDILSAWMKILEKKGA